MNPETSVSGRGGAAWHAWAALVAALVLLNASLTFENVWPTPKVRPGATLSIELAACLLIVMVSRRLQWQAGGWLIPCVWVVLVFGRYLDVTAPGLYGREFNLYWDSQHLGNVAAMLARAAPAWLIAAAAAAAAAIVVLVFLVARLAIARVESMLAWTVPRRMLGAAAAVVVAVWSGQALAGQPNRILPFGDPVTTAYLRQARYVLAMMGPRAVAPPLAPSPDVGRALPALDGNDVLLVFLESYGAVTWDAPAIAAGLRESRGDLEGAVRETGREVVSAYVESPTFGGSSWLAHLSLISGVEVRDQYAYASLMASTRDTLVTSFTHTGYRTVALMPGMRQPWPEGAFYGFDQIYGRTLLEYGGPEFGWWSIPDQYALAKIDELERRRSPRDPLLIVFPTSTTHAPFGPVPPYQPDWGRVLTSKAFEPAEVERAMGAQPDLTNLRPSYTRAMAYEYVTLAGYLRRHPHDDGILIAIGDHQPPAAVSGPGASWSVPAHVFGRRGPVLDHLLARGFRRGLAPRRPPLGPMHELTSLLLDAFAGEGDSFRYRSEPVSSARSSR